MKSFRLLAAGLSLLAASSGFAATDPVSVVVDTGLPTVTGVYGQAYPLIYDLTNNTSRAISGNEVVMSATGGAIAETSGCATIAAGATCEWRGTLTPDSANSTANLTLKYNGIEIPLGQESMSSVSAAMMDIDVGGALSSSGYLGQPKLLSYTVHNPNSSGVTNLAFTPVVQGGTVAVEGSSTCGDTLTGDDGNSGGTDECVYIVSFTPTGTAGETHSVQIDVGYTISGADFEEALATQTMSTVAEPVVITAASGSPVSPSAGDYMGEAFTVSFDLQNVSGIAISNVGAAVANSVNGTLAYSSDDCAAYPAIGIGETCTWTGTFTATGAQASTHSAVLTLAPYTGVTFDSPAQTVTVKAVVPTLDTDLPASGGVSTGVALQYTFTNNSSEAITDFAVTTAETNGAISGESGCTGTIAADGGTCTWSATFTPAAEGAATVQLTLTYLTSTTDVLAQRSMTAANGASYVAVGDNDSIVTSEDGITWTKTEFDNGSDTYRMNAVAYGNGHWVAVGQKNNSSALIIESTDGESWTEQSVTGAVEAVEFKDVAYANNVWVVAGLYSSSLATSNPLIVVGDSGASNWTSKSTGSNHKGFYTVVYDADNTNWYVMGDQDASPASDGVVYSGDNGVSWSAISSEGTGNKFTSAGYDDITGTILALDTVSANKDVFSASWSDSDLTWSAALKSFGSNMKALAYGNNVWVAVGTDTASASGGNARMAYSIDDGATWPAISMAGVGGQFHDVAYGSNAPGDDWVAVGKDMEVSGNSSLLTSADGTNWTSRTITNGSTDMDLYGVAVKPGS